MTSSLAHHGPARGAVRRGLVAGLACGILAAAPSTALADHDGDAMDGMACPHAAAGMGPATGQAPPSTDAPTRSASLEPIQAPSQAPAQGSSGSAPAKAPAASAPAAPPAERPAAASEPATQQSSAPASEPARQNAKTPAAKAVTAPAPRVAAEPSVRATPQAAAPAPAVRAAGPERSARRAARTGSAERAPSRRSSAPRPVAERRAVPAGMRRPDVPPADPAVTAAPAARPQAAGTPIVRPQASAPEPGAPVALLAGLGALAIGALTVLALVARRRGGGAGPRSSLRPRVPSGADPVERELQEMIAEASARTPGVGPAQESRPESPAVPPR